MEEIVHLEITCLFKVVSYWCNIGDELVTKILKYFERLVRNLIDFVMLVALFLFTISVYVL